MRENTDQDNSEYGHFLPSKRYIHLAGECYRDILKRSFYKKLTATHNTMTRNSSSNSKKARHVLKLRRNIDLVG